MTVFKKSGAAGLNFAFIGHWEAYHTPLDNPQQLNRGSLQHHGENALSLSRRLGNADLTLLQDRDAVYFSLPGNLFLHYSSRFIWPLVIGLGAFLLELALIFYANGAWQTRPLGILLGLFAYVGIFVSLLLLGFAFEHSSRWLQLHALPEGDLVQNPFYALGLIALVTALQATLYKLLRKKIAAPAFFLGGALLIFALVLVTSKWLPGVSFLFVWPLLAVLLATVTVAFRPGRLSLSAVSVLCLLSLPALLIFLPLLKGFYGGLGFSSIGAPLMGLTFGLCLFFLSPLLESLFAASGKFLTLAALFVAIGLCLAGVRTTRYRPDHPKPSMLFYALDADSGATRKADF
jgi:hypothetical protein